MTVYHSSTVQISRRSQLDKMHFHFHLSLQNKYTADGIVSNIISLTAAIQHSLMVGWLVSRSTL
jgi:hypothetical protein